MILHNRDFSFVQNTINEMWKQFKEAVLKLVNNNRELSDILETKNPSWEAAEIIVSLEPKVYKTYKVVIDYEKSFTEMKELGKYDYSECWVNDRNYPIMGIGQHRLEMVLVHLNRFASIREVEYYLMRQKLTPAKLEHLLAFGAAYPELQRQFPIVAIGSVWMHDIQSYFCPSLNYNDRGRVIDHHWFYYSPQCFDATCHFLAIRKAA